ncbi:MAG: recombination regulator RecX [Gammaproteobacteria bacterium]|nr:recombination regulator RecX [Gammaproteobacteria bacterium]
MDSNNSSNKPEIAIRRAAMDLLARREHSFQELTEKLQSRFPDEDVIPPLEKLREENLQSDQRYLEAYVRYRSNRGFGPLKIEAELYPKGLDSTQVREALYSEEYDWTELCHAAKEKRFGSTDLSKPKERARCQRFLQGRGFGFDQIRGCLE